MQALDANIGKEPSMEKMRTIRVFGIENNSIVDGPGIRLAVFCQGCPRSCPGCHNPESQLVGDEHGRDVSFDAILDYIEGDPLVSGITFTGGDPFLQPRQCKALAEEFRERFPDKDIWAWSGYTFEEIVDDELLLEFAKACDVLVDGPYVESKRTLSSPWVGSSNQRIIDMRKSEKGKISLFSPDNA